jgi:hypothetical protein
MLIRTYHPGYEWQQARLSKSPAALELLNAEATGVA